MSKIFFLASIAFISFGEFGAQANPFGFSSTEFRLSLESSYFTTNSNFDSNGNSINLPNGNQLTEMRFKLTGSYDITDWLGVFGNCIFNREDAVSNSVERVNTGFSQGLIGVDGIVWSHFINIVPEASLIIPFSSFPDPTSTTGSLLGDGVYVGSGKINLSKSFRNFGLWGYGGYSYLSNGLSSYIPYGFNIHGAIKSFFSDVGVNGISSLNNDQYSSNIFYRQQTTNFVDGGSLLYYAVNPSWTHLNFDIGLRLFRNYQISTGVEQSLAGTDTAQGTRFLLTLNYVSWPLRPRYQINNKPDGFKPDEFNVDTHSEDIQTKEPK